MRTQAPQKLGIVPHDWQLLADDATREAIEWYQARNARKMTETEKLAIRAGCGAMLHALVSKRIVAISSEFAE